MKTLSDIQANTPTSLSARISCSIPFFVVIPLFLIVCVTHAYAGQVTLGWDQNTEPDLAGYKIYYGNSSGNYTQSKDVIGKTATSCIITNLTEGQTYYFAATAYNSSLVESNYSAEVSCTINPATTSVPTTTTTVQPTTSSSTSSIIPTTRSNNYNDDTADNHHDSAADNLKQHIVYYPDNHHDVRPTTTTTVQPTTSSSTSSIIPTTTYDDTADNHHDSAADYLKQHVVNYPDNQRPYNDDTADDHDCRRRWQKWGRGWRNTSANNHNNGSADNNHHCGRDKHNNGSGRDNDYH